MLTKRITKKDYPSIKQALFEQQNGLCALCGRPLEGDLESITLTMIMLYLALMPDVCAASYVTYATVQKVL